MTIFSIFVKSARLMRNKLLAIILLYSTVAFSQSAADFVSNQLIIKIKESRYSNTGVQLENRSFGLPLLDNLGLQHPISKITPIGQHVKTQTFLLVFEG